MSQKLLQKAGRLGQKNATWFCVTQLAPAWVGSEEEGFTRPYLTLVLDLDNGLIRGYDLREAPYDDPQQLLTVLARAMLQTPGNADGKFRPARIYFTDPAVAEMATEPLGKMGIYAAARKAPKAVQEVLTHFETFMRGAPPIPSLLDTPGATKKLAHELFAAAAAYYRRAPWRTISDSHPIAVSYPEGATARYAVVMGNAGEAFGLAVYDSVAELARIYSGVEMAADPDLEWLTIMFGPEQETPLADLADIEKYGWPVAGQSAYPFIVVARADGEAGRPDADDMTWLAAALRALPDFVEGHLSAVLTEPPDDTISATYPLPDFYQGDSIRFTYPVYDEVADQLAEAAIEELELFMDGWAVDENQEETAYEMGAFLLTFLSYQTIAQELDEDEWDRYYDLCWCIGAQVLDYGEGEFSPDIFLEEPRYVAEFIEELAEDEAEGAEYEEMWREIGDFVRENVSLSDPPPEAPTP